MADDVTRALAFVARRQGRRAMPESEWAFVMAMDLGWMPPPRARELVQRAQEAGLLEPAEGGLRLRVDPALVDVPPGFRPDPGAQPSPQAADPFPEWVQRLAQARSLPRERVLEEVAARQEALAGLLDAQAAVLWLAAEAGLDVREAAQGHLRALRAATPAPAPAARP